MGQKNTRHVTATIIEHSRNTLQHKYLNKFVFCFQQRVRRALALEVVHQQSHRLRRMHKNAGLESRFTVTP